MDTIAMDTHPLIAPLTGAAANVVTRQDPALPSSGGRQIPAMSDIPVRRGQANDGENAVLRRSCEHPFAAR